jgi:hypothetical protein
MSDPRMCKHRVGFDRMSDGSLPYCPECDLIWHEDRLAEAKAAVARHQRKRDEAIAAISRTCGDA